ncbi:MAG TPA: hypothetical protein V6D19_20835 [Stenomitos sp.]
MHTTSATGGDRHPELTQPSESKVYIDNPYLSQSLLFTKTNTHTIMPKFHRPLKTYRPSTAKAPATALVLSYGLNY